MEINILREVSNEQLNLHFKELWEEDQPKYIVYRRKEITEISGFILIFGKSNTVMLSLKFV